MTLAANARQKLKVLLMCEEGFRSLPYRDIRGVLTIGYGRNLDSKGISQDEALVLLDDDIQDCLKDLLHILPEFSKQDDARQVVLIDMCFNMGIDNLMQFREMISALHVGDYALASKAMLDSLWAKQVGARAEKLAYIMETGNV
jgi:lysozyme